MRSLTTLFFLILPASAEAHLGHVGEVAGHSHWIALGAGVVAAAIAAAIGKKKLDAEADPAEETVEEDGEPEAAGA